ncbi:MAG: hypothetical protein QOE20_5471 [Mycobacterium sp.]|nr:hypothetical protein [Mycobacterium sp.]
MALLVFSIIFVIGGVVAYAVGHATNTPAPKLGGGALMVLGLLVFLFSALVVIGTQDIGVKTSFGRLVGHGLKSGIHWKASWVAVHRLDAKQQTDTYASEGFNGSTQSNAQGPCIDVRIARQATACVNITIRWQNDQQGVDYLFQNFKTDDNIRDNLLHRDLQTAVNVAFARYDPLGLDVNGNSTQPTTGQLADQVLKELQSQVGQYLDISKVFIPIFNFDPETQQRLNQLQLQVAQTRIAIQAQQTAKAQAKANAALAHSLSNNPGVLESKCLDILQEAVNKGQPLPAGFSCFPGGNAAIAVTPGTTNKTP